MSRSCTLSGRVKPKQKKMAGSGPRHACYVYHCFVFLDLQALQAWSAPHGAWPTSTAFGGHWERLCLSSVWLRGVWAWLRPVSYRCNSSKTSSVHSLRYGSAWMLFLILGLYAAMKLHPCRARQYWILWHHCDWCDYDFTQDRWKGSLKSAFKSAYTYFLSVVVRGALLALALWSSTQRRRVSGDSFGERRRIAALLPRAKNKYKGREELQKVPEKLYQHAHPWPW